MTVLEQTLARRLWPKQVVYPGTGLTRESTVDMAL